MRPIRPQVQASLHFPCRKVRPERKGIATLRSPSCIMHQIRRKVRPERKGIATTALAADKPTARAGSEGETRTKGDCDRISTSQSSGPACRKVRPERKGIATRGLRPLGAELLLRLPQGPRRKVRPERKGIATRPRLPPRGVPLLSRRKVRPERKGIATHAMQGRDRPIGESQGETRTKGDCDNHSIT